MIPVSYSQLLGRPYVDGFQDCYGLVRAFYDLAYGIKLRNYARPYGFDHAGLNLIQDFLGREGFQACHDAAPQLGDGLVFGILSSKMNHVGVYVGNGMFIHHVAQQTSRQEALDERWKRRLLARVRHPDVTEWNRNNLQKLDMMQHLPPHIRRKMGLV